jgi:hypothetical protein
MAINKVQTENKITMFLTLVPIQIKGRTNGGFSFVGSCQISLIPTAQSQQLTATMFLSN